ncbi:putative fructose-biphosphate aldolase [Candidatus Kuenenia stuttgartiensis]|uniref:Putative fructose-biphosphate aldolase n=1 Tax=Kuenenia stuttgartiensis TaxID=174633 RepID=Q1PYR9_KUEST|nr:MULTISPECIES: class II fructose-bisphosphate aldolase [Kuenenia]MBE7548572.1 class II fructose-bisphosphate aldolase [Planctomycetia bacterium]MBZ0190434.1 class II fructose-bisphosphate aldolase [Candidatus Kuenenia stuttgartiensis]MCF6152272.1 aldolase [Candidatus Kuenenia stuttgartiensis]MCL4726858.1 class II fructose-bisphosphate aldolase [Candidatus Kuenenia stuttgartiensis]MCZ7624249.1 class II fructose-bisphosphate aldolase [Candidatus Kuenenia sp.]
MLYTTKEELFNNIKGIIDIQKDGTVSIINKDALRTKTIDKIVYNAVFNSDSNLKDISRWLIWSASNALGNASSSIQSLYDAMGRREYKGFTVPAINIRGLTYDVARAVFCAAKKNNAAAIIFEIARSEIGYTGQRPAEYTAVVLAAAIREGHEYPVFIQGDHFQIILRKYQADKEAELATVKNLIKEAIDGGFYNIDVDTSTLVDLSKPDLAGQQRLNFELAAELTAYIRSLEPKGITISVGGEIGEVGKKNSTIEELRAFMDGYNATLKTKGSGLKGISKISVQTGTSHGGVVLPDGTIANVKLDFDTLKTLSNTAKDEYGMSGAVQHGASTLPADAFSKFPEADTAEVHLATEFQNMIYDNSAFPADFKKEIYELLKDKCRSEWKEGQTEEQFIYTTRKMGFGPFKQKFWDLPENIRAKIGQDLEDKFDFLFKKLNIVNSKEIIKNTIQPVPVKVALPTP